MREWLALLVVVGGASASCGDSVSTAAEPLTLFAAASTTDAVQETLGAFGRPVRTSFGASSALARQIADGAPADVFVSASRTWMEYLRERGRLAEEPLVLCGNLLVVIARTDSRWFTSPRTTTLAELARSLRADELVAIADAGVPAGDYTRESLENAGLLASFAPRFVGQTDVRAVLRAVATGQATAGFVYRTDARAANVAVLVELDPKTHEKVEVLAALVDGPRTEAARELRSHLASSDSRRELRRAGFVIEESDAQQR